MSLKMDQFVATRTKKNPQKMCANGFLDINLQKERRTLTLAQTPLIGIDIIFNAAACCGNVYARTVVPT
jgi:hypothetical protein